MITKRMPRASTLIYILFIIAYWGSFQIQQKQRKKCESIDNVRKENNKVVLSPSRSRKKQKYDYDEHDYKNVKKDDVGGSSVGSGGGKKNLIIFNGLHKVKYDPNNESHNALVESKSRIYNFWNISAESTTAYDWCIPVSRYNNNKNRSIQELRKNKRRLLEDKNKGLVYIKVAKAASSTGAGITIRIANNVAQRQYPHYKSNLLKYKSTSNKKKKEKKNNNKQQIWPSMILQQQHQQQNDNDANNDNNIVCKNVHSHRFANQKKFGNRDRSQSLLWTFIRKPSDRSISHYFFRDVGRANNTPTVNTTLSALKKSKSFQFKYLYPRDRELVSASKRRLNVQNIHDLSYHIQTHIINYYDFIGIAERMEESLVVFKILFHLQDTDIIVLKSKSSGGYDDGNYNDKCNVIPKSFVAPRVQKYINKSFETNNADILLYEVANKSLDKTVQYINEFFKNPNYVKQAIKRHQKLQKIANKYCLEEAVFPCSKEGVLQTEKSALSCYENDFGCGHKCVDKIIMKYPNGEIA